MSKLQIVMYHYVRNLKQSRFPKIKGMDYQLFKDQIFFLKNNFNIVTMEEVIEAWNSPGMKLPEKALLLTFDDGYIDNFQFVFPVLKENGLQGSFFIPGKTFAENTLLDVNKIHFLLASAEIGIIVDDIFCLLEKYRDIEGIIPSNQELYSRYAVANRFDNKDTIFVKRILQTILPENMRNKISEELFKKYVGVSEEVFARELYMNYDQIKCMKSEGMFIGLHGYDHYWLGNLPKEQMQQDIEKALSVMEEFVEKDAWVLNYPYGSYNNDVLFYMEQRGCKLGMTTEVRIADTEVDNRFMLPRLDCNDFPPKSENYLSIK